MKYVVFTIAAIGIPPLAILVYINKKWLVHVLGAMAIAMSWYIPTSINFYSFESYRGSSRGMEISLLHLLAMALLLSFALGQKISKFFPDMGTKLYLLYTLLCLPSFSNAADTLFSWFEIWKMIMLYLYFLAIYYYITATKNMDAVLKMLATFIFVNMFFVVRDHFSGFYQPHGAFPHQNCMAMGMQLMGPMFFAAFLMKGFKPRMGRLCAAAFVCAAGATLRSYSRMAMVLMPVAYGIPFILLIRKVGFGRITRRIIPFAIVGAMGFAAIVPRIIERFLNAPEASGNTRIELARCAVEMIKDEPLWGIGANNWGIKINAPYEYAERAERVTNRTEDFQDGIVETVYLLVAAECGIPALCAMAAWFLWYLVMCFRLVKTEGKSPDCFIPAGLAGGLTAIYIQSAFEWVLRQQLNLICLMTTFALISYLKSSSLMRKSRYLKEAA